MDRPIIFSGAMVRAILREIREPGTGKTQTRRVLTPQPPTREQFPGSDFGLDRAIADGVKFYSQNDYERLPKHPTHWELLGSVGVAMKAGFRRRYNARFGVGDRLWVRENWALHDRAADVGIVAYQASIDHAGWTEAHEQIPVAQIPKGIVTAPFQRGWKPSIHMPRAFSRLSLPVTDVRVQRLQDISEADAIAEGILRLEGGNGDQWADYPLGTSAAGWEDPRESFRTLWDSINGKPRPRKGKEPLDLSWNANPWVVAVTFQPELRNIDREPT